MRTIFLFFLIVILFSNCQSLQQDSVTSRPNVLFIMSDDHAFQALSAYSDLLIQTPNIDRIADGGMVFDRAYVTNSICAPSRAVILTGKHSHLNGLYDNGVRFDSTQMTFPKILQNNGYQTAVIGKWHLKTRPTGFDYYKVLPGQGHYYNPDFITAEGRSRDTGYVTDLITDEAIRWMDEIKSNDEPFMLMYQHKAPHREWLAKPEHFQAFTSKNFPEPTSLFDTYENRGRAAHEAEMRISDHMGLTNDSKIPPDIAQELGYEDFLKWYSNAYRGSQQRMTQEQKANWDATYNPIIEQFKTDKLTGDKLTKWKYQRYMQDYLASIAGIDQNVGRILDFLDASGLADNTVVIYTSDQGFYLGEHGWFDKRFMYEESYRTPLLVKWPDKIKSGVRSDQLVQNLDLAQTILDITQCPTPDEMQGLSLVPLMTDEHIDKWRDALYYHYYEYPGIHAVKRHYGVSTDRYKLIHFYHDIDEWELYDLETDPQEMKNVYSEENYAGIQSKMHEKLSVLITQYQDTVAMKYQPM